MSSKVFKNLYLLQNPRVRLMDLPQPMFMNTFFFPVHQQPMHIYYIYYPIYVYHMLSMS
jgi:hypothetical protein